TAPSEPVAHAISTKLEKLQPQTKSALIYVLNTNGVGVASSDWALPMSAVGSDYSFRDYFRLALKNGHAEQFAMGTVSRHPGLYLAHRVERNGRPIGVVVVKVEFNDLETAWLRSGDETFITDTNGTVLLTSNPTLRFRPMPAAGREQILTSLPALADGWRLQLLSSRAPARQQALSATLIAALSEALAVILLTWIWRRQKLALERAEVVRHYLEQLELNVAARTQELSAEITERQHAERRLSALQADLVQANKLAALGQITAGVAHEINQPLATIRVLADNALSVLANARVAAGQEARSDLGDIVRMTERIGHITRELRAFSRKATSQSRPIALKASIDSSILLSRSRQRTHQLPILRETLDPKLKVMGDRLRLEQVIVNLLQNAFEALEERPDPQVRLGVETDDEWVILSISDNGPGLDPEIAKSLFTPFITTKSNGLGLGLVIARDVLRDFGGELHVDSSPQGARFRIKLRPAKS
ncbi:MAG: integral rane sensor signal transduction histidine kinase, partial [Caulobacteraceae bacterium]|nr:integral rane sensor signal transduction histidine kinase [Caulobacteraceae bacterium]